MKQITYILFFLQCFNSSQILSQNLVPDSSFEAVHRLPVKKFNGASCTKNWSCPTAYGAGDYYHTNGKGNGSAPRNIFGKQKPHSGNAYAGMCIRKNFIEYLHTKLIDSLEKDQEYLVEFYICRAERSLGAIKELGVMFSDKISMGITGLGIPKKPSIEMVKKNGFRNKHQWMKFSATYKAKGGEMALILGYFNYNPAKRYKGYAHYYVDDVSVTPINRKIQAATTFSFEEETPTRKRVLPKFNEAIILDGIFFTSAKNELLPESFVAIDKLAAHLKILTEASVEINGYEYNNTDEVQNQLLSELRAKAVAYYLISKGIHPSRINFTGYGSAKPQAKNLMDENKETNSCIEYILKKP
jgi:outer membrane protein OmpA-like peptidoglycan-associated protein